MAPKLYLTETSPPVRSVLITAAALGLELDKQEVDVLQKEHLTPEFIKLNPQHTVPTLVDGDYVLWDSHAINPYLVGKYGKDDSLYPKDYQKRGTVDNRLHFNNATVFSNLKKVASPIFQGTTNKVSEEHVKMIETDIYAILNTFLEQTKFVADDKVTIADFCLIASITSVNVVVPLDEAKFPKVVEWIKKVKELPCYAANEPGLKKLEAWILPKLK